MGKKHWSFVMFSDPICGLLIWKPREKNEKKWEKWKNAKKGEKSEKSWLSHTPSIGFLTKNAHFYPQKKAIFGSDSGPPSRRPLFRGKNTITHSRSPNRFLSPKISKRSQKQAQKLVEKLWKTATQIEPFLTHFWPQNFSLLNSKIEGSQNSAAK